MDKLKAFFKRSVTILWARLVALAGIVMGFVPMLLSDSSLNDAIRAVLDPKYVPFYILAIGVVTELCRRRTAGT